MIRWQIHPDWGDSWPWEHARFRSTSCDGGNAQRVHEQGSAHTESGAWHMHECHERGPASPTRGWVNVGVVLRVARVGHDASRRTALCVTDRKCGRACNEYENRGTKSTILLARVGKEREEPDRLRRSVGVSLLSVTLIALECNDSHLLPSLYTITAIVTTRYANTLCARIR